MQYPVESFTEAERERLAPHFTNLDRPVFALVDLPETVKGALFARYSRYQGTLRRLFLDEFAGDVPTSGAGRDAGEGERAAKLYERIFLGYGDDSVAQLGGAHIACEWVSNVLTKILQRPRLGAYLEQSTRYIAYDAPMPDPPGGYRYYCDSRARAALRAGDGRAVLDLLAGAAAGGRLGGRGVPPRADEAPAAHERAIKAKALDLLRGLLPASSLSHMGIFATGQTYEQLILHLLAHPLPEARSYGRMILDEVKAVMPSFVTRVERPDRGGEWIGYLESRAAPASAGRSDSGCARPSADADHGPSVALTQVHGDEDDLLAALLFESSTVSEDARPRGGRRGWTPTNGPSCWATSSATAPTAATGPGAASRRVRYRFEIVSDYGAFRDLQRHRMLTPQWQTLTPDLGAGVPEQVELAGCGDDYRRALEVSHREYDRLVAAGLATAAPYALCLGYRIRYVLDLNAREAMQLIELRSGREGHPSYRAVAHEMHAQIAAVHPAVAAAMTHVDRETEPRLERILSELRSHARAG